MSEEKREKDFREWWPDTTARNGRERGLASYEGYLGFRREELEGKRILDLGSGETEKFSRELKAENINASVISLNPDYSKQSYRKTMSNIPDWARRSVAVTAQELPFQDEAFDKVFALFSVSVFSSPSPFGGNLEATRHWMLEVARVLKHGGEARIAPLDEMTTGSVLLGDYKPFIDLIRNLGMEVGIEEMKNKDIGYTHSTKSWIDKEGKHHEETEDVGERIVCTRMVIRKP